MQTKEIQYYTIAAQARRYYEQGQYLAAEQSCEKLLQLKKNAPDALDLRARASWMLGERDKAIRSFEQYLKQKPNDIEARLNMGRWLTLVGRGREAVRHFQRGLRIASNQPHFIAGLASAHIAIGEDDKAEQLLQPCIDSNDEHWMIARVYAELQRDKKNYSEAIRVAQRHLHDDPIEEMTKRALHFLIAQCQEKLGEADQAFESYKAGRAMLAGPFDPDAHDEEVRQMMDVFSAEALAKMPRAAVPTDLPIFIISRPRSGSTLVERIIASHPKAHAGGELMIMPKILPQLALHTASIHPFPQCVVDLHQDHVDHFAKEYIDKVRAMAPTASRITDKNIGNWFRLGLIELLFPQARIIDLRRNAVDNCFSCWTSMLDPVAYSFANDLYHAGRAYRAYEALMRHWKDVLTIPVLTVRYRDLVHDQETWTHRIIDFVGLPWHDDCLEFHKSAEKYTQTAAVTMSQQQVRQPMYKSSVGRATQFEKYLEPLKRGLEDGRKKWNLDEQF